MGISNELAGPAPLDGEPAGPVPPERTSRIAPAIPEPLAAAYAASAMFLGVLLACLLQSPPPAPSAPAAVEVQIPESTLWASFDVAEWKHDAQLETRLSEQYGRGALTAGRFGRAALTLRHVAATDGRGSRAWRDELGAGEHFEVGPVACLRSEQRLPGEGRTMVRFTALPVAGGHVFQLHVNALRVGEVDSCSQPQFEAIVRSWKLQSVRRGRPADLPLAARDELFLGLQAWPGWADSLPEGDEPSPVRLFVRAELGRLAPGATLDTGAGYERARRALAEIASPSRDERALLLACEDALGSAALDGGDAQRALAHFERASALASALPHSGRGSIELDCARTLARLGRDDAALDALARALAAETRLLLRARDEPDFARLRTNLRFRELVHLAD